MPIDDDPNPGQQIQKDQSSKGGKLPYVKPAEKPERNVDENIDDSYKSNEPTDPKDTQIKK